MNGWRALSIGVLLFAAAGGCNRGQEAAPPAKATGPIEERNGLWYAVGTSNLYSGTLAHQYPSGTNSVESVYTNGMKLFQRAWHTNGVLKTEFLFHQGQLAIRRSWDANGKRLAWKHEKLAVVQTQHGFNLLDAGKFVEGYVWVHFAAANGQPEAKRALQQLQPGMTKEQRAEARAIAEKLLAPDSN